MRQELRKKEKSEQALQEDVWEMKAMLGQLLGQQRAA